MDKHIEDHINQVLELKKTDSWSATKHYLDKESAYAIIAAVNANRPLLVCGEPGVGKSQLARAAAHLLGREFIASVIQPNSSYEDLLWSFDHTSRLADAQLNDKEKVNDPNNYISAGVLWYALDWENVPNGVVSQTFQPPKGLSSEAVKKNGLVLLIDEIDKADISLSNGLLEVFGNNGFNVPPLGKTIPDDEQEEKIKPLVVLTSNDTRQLPDAFRRRCVVLTIKLPDNEEGLMEYLETIGKTHYPQLDPRVLQEAAKQIVEDRFNCQGQKTGQAEYLDLLRALNQLAKTNDEQLEWLVKIADCFKKS